MKEYLVRSSSAVDKDLLFRLTSKKDDLTTFAHYHGRILFVEHTADEIRLDIFYAGNRAKIKVPRSEFPNLFLAETVLQTLEQKTIDVLVDEDKFVSMIGFSGVIDSYRRTEDLDI